MANTNASSAADAIIAGDKIARIWGTFIEGSLAKRGDTVTTYILDGNQFTTQAIRNVVNNKLLNLGPDDAIFFYYIGHGENIAGTPYPRLLIPDQISGDETGLSFGRIAEVLKSRKAGFLLAVAEACNSFPPGGSDVIYRFGDFSQQIEDLFFNATGSIVVTTASPGEFAHASPTFGGYYSSVLFNTIGAEIGGAQTSQRRASWDRIIQAANHAITVGEEVQTPQIWVEK